MADLFVEMPFDAEVWPACTFEPLTLAIVLPFASQSPWKFRYISFVSDYNRSLQMLWKDDFRMGGDSLLNLLLTSRALESLPENMVRKCYKVSREEDHRVVQSQEEDGLDLTYEDNKLRYFVARNGDHLIIPFQCELYHF